jgi:hypothetical protein
MREFESPICKIRDVLSSVTAGNYETVIYPGTAFHCKAAYYVIQCDVSCTLEPQAVALPFPGELAEGQR